MISKFNFLRLVCKGKAPGLIGLDVGTVFIGVAVVYDPFGKGRPAPVTTLNRRNCDINLEIQKLLLNIDGIVVGKPEKMTTSRDYITDTINVLAQTIPLPFVTTNEDFSTVEASQLLYKTSLRYSKSKYLKDQVSACIILENFIKYSKETMKRLPN
jgi:putative transcription antitermination factor YqgF